MKVILSVSALQPSQYRQYAKGWKPDQKLLEAFEKQSHKRGKKAYRVYFDYGTGREFRVPDSHVPQKIMSYLLQNNLELLDYVAGTVQDKHDRVVRLGKVLSKEPELKKLFDNDSNRRQLVTAATGNKLVCISMHPYDIAGMSTDRGWTSCMNLTNDPSESQTKHIKFDVKSNALIAYLINSDDKNIEKPISRILIKRFSAERNTAHRYIAELAYPDASDRLFITSVQEWIDKHINSVVDKADKPQVKARAKGTYDDGVGDLILTGLEKLTDMGIDKVFDFLDAANERKEKYAKANKIRGASVSFDKPSISKLFNAVPQVLFKYKNIRKLTGYQTEKLWAEAIKDKADRYDLIEEAFKEFKKSKNTTTPYMLLDKFASDGDFRAVQIADKYLPVEEYLKEGGPDDAVHSMYLREKNAAKILTLASGLSKFTKDENQWFWRILCGNCTSKESEFNVPTIIGTMDVMRKLNSPNMTLANLTAAKKYLMPQLFDTWKFLLGKTPKYISFTLPDVGFTRHGYSESRSAIVDIMEYVVANKNRLTYFMPPEDFNWKSSIIIGMNQSFARQKLLDEIREKVFANSGGDTTVTVPVVGLEFFDGDYGTVLETSAGEWSPRDFEIEFDVTAKDTFDRKTGQLLFTFSGDEENVEEAVHMLKQMMAQ